MANIDDLLGLGESGDETIGEDDVLQMLGIAEEAAIDSEFEQLGTSEAGSPAVESEVQQLEVQQNQLDAQTRNLQDRISEQEQKIASLQTNTPASQASQAQSSAFSSQYQNALQTYRSRHYQSAIQQFEGLLAQNSRHSLSDNAQYWIGESYYGLGNYQKAITAFEKVFTFSNSNKDDAAQLKLGLCYMKLNDPAKARQELQKLIDNYPTSESVSLARRLLSQIQSAP